MAATLPRSAIEAIVAGRHGDPFAVLGPHEADGAIVVRAFVPGADRVDAVTPDGELLAPLARLHAAGFFEGAIPGRSPYRLRAANRDGAWTVDDPYAYGPVLGPIDDWLVGEGTHASSTSVSARIRSSTRASAGVHFAVWAPNARRVSVVGDFNGWDGRRHPMRKRVDTGVWEIFVPALRRGRALQVRDHRRRRRAAAAEGRPGRLRRRAAAVDRLGRAATRPASRGPTATWMAARGAARAAPRADVDLRGAPRLVARAARATAGSTYDELADTLVPYAVDMGFTHVELMPVTEHPLDASWGYQPIGLFAPTSRFGEPAGFARFVDRCHRAGLGVILDWVPAHFPTDPHGLAQLRRHRALRARRPAPGLPPGLEHRDLQLRAAARSPTSSIANALFWLDRYHVDGLRVDAVASMLYLDYSRKAGEWVPNRHGGNENLEAVAFLRRLNEAVYGRHPGAITIAEESTAWPGVSQPTLRRRARLRLQVEHGVDARHARVHARRTRCTGAGTTTR